MITFAYFFRIVIVIFFVIDIILHMLGKLTDAHAAYQIACDIFLYLLWFPKDNER
jgi:hypothetical protein